MPRTPRATRLEAEAVSRDEGSPVAPPVADTSEPSGYWRHGQEAGMRRIAMVVFPGIMALDAVGPLEVFATANLIAAQTSRGRKLYDLQVVATRDRPVPTSVGMSVNPNCRLEDLPAPLDTVLISGGLGQEESREEPPADSDNHAWLLRHPDPRGKRAHHRRRIPPADDSL